MKKIIVTCGLFLLTLSAFAGNRISNELATVKACDEAVTNNYFSLSDVYDASVSDTGKTLTVELSYKDGNADCKNWSWYKHDGTATVCEPCQGSSNPCQCAPGMCVSPSEPVQMKYINVN